MGHLITGAKGQAHITPKNDAVIHRGLMGVESCILDYGEKLAPMLVPSQPTNIRILDGCGMMQGRFFEIEEGSYDTIAIPNGAQGYSRIDLVCAKITQNENGTQSFSWEVVQGTQTSGTPQPATVAEGSLDDGDEFALMPIASVELEGVNIVAVETVATISTAGERLSLDTDTTEGVDKELTDALTSLGWLSSVIDGVRGLLNVKKLLTNLVKEHKQVQCGEFTAAANWVAANSIIERHIEFDTPFRTAPAVTLTFGSGTSSINFAKCSLCVTDITTNGFTLRVINSHTAAFSPYVEWIAIEK